MKQSWTLMLLYAAMLMPGSSSRADLDAYLRKPEPVYKWEKTGETKAEGCTIYDLHLVSQTWQGIVWEHHLQIYRVDNMAHPHFCALLNTGGSGSQSDETLGLMAAKATGGVFAILFNIPNQPLYGGKTEDALIAYTWQKFIETGDETWPLHFPMAKAVIKAMDAIQAFTKQNGDPSVDNFLITGASKRGWTTWLAGASQDPRIKAIAPMVIDTLNAAEQMPHQIAAYGKPSEQIKDYTDTGLLDISGTERGRRLLQIEDPYSYRDRLTLPKLIISATNDRYWAQDAVNLYWDGLKDPKWLLYNPNVGHSMAAVDAQLRIIGTMGAFAASVSGGHAMPKLKWAYKEDASGVSLTTHSDIVPVSAKLYHTTAATQDFRDSKWVSEPITLSKDSAVAHLDRPASGYEAAYAEITYEVGGKTYALTTQIHILSSDSASTSK